MIVGFTCGSYDLLHAGHVLALQEIRSKVDRLVVGLQTDPSLDRPEKNRPVQRLDERMIQLAALGCVDEVLVYETEADLVSLLLALSDRYGDDLVRYLGADWRGRQFTGRQLPIRVEFNSRDHGYSTSELRRRVVESERERERRTTRPPVRQDEGLPCAPRCANPRGCRASGDCLTSPRRPRRA